MENNTKMASINLNGGVIMKKSIKSLQVIFVTIVSLLSLTFVAFATDEIQPRWANINSTRCTLTISGTTANVSGSISFVEGKTCHATLDLLCDGDVIASWSDSDSSGRLHIVESVRNLDKGSYQAILYFDCGTDSDSKSSTKKTIS